MISNIRAVRIKGIFHRDLTPVIISALEEAAVVEYQLTASRWITLRERKGFFGLMAEARVIDHPVDMVTLLVTPESELGVLDVIIKSGDLTTPGRGSVFSEEVVVYRAHELCRIFDMGFRETGDSILQRELTGICCIVQKGEGDAIARVLLDTGTCVPAITYGHGTGVRDKLGLLRITIPAEKEVVTMMASSYDAEILMNLLISTGKLNQPGKGFIYLYPIRAGQINMKVIQGMPRHAASMEHIILTIDEMRGGSSWRARGGSIGIDALEQDEYLHDLVSLTLTCDEGRGETLVKTAMQAGVPGATMTKTKHVCPPHSDSIRISPAREVCNMILARSQVEYAVRIMEEHNALDDNTHGQFCISSVPKAYTFIARR
jgi:hypothetical protein